MSGPNEIYIYVIDTDEIICITTGTGDNLTAEDIKNGYVDYLNYNTYTLDNGIEESDGGMLLLTESETNTYKSLKDTIPAILKDVYDNEQLKYKFIR